MLKGTCVKCNRDYYGWALEQEQEHQCGCGGTLKISRIVSCRPSVVEDHPKKGDRKNEAEM